MIIPSGFAQVNLDWNWVDSDKHAEVAYGIAVDDETLSVLEVAATVSTIYGDAGMQAIQTDAIELVNIHVKFGPNDTGAAADLTTSLAGSLTGNAVTPNVALLVKKFTSFGGRRGSGRSYWPGIQEGVVSDTGILDTDARDVFNGKFADFVAGHIDANIPIYLLHADEVQPPHAVNSMGVDSLVATQRRRLRS